MPGITPVLGRTESEAREKYEELQALLPDDLALQSLSHISGGLDLTQFPLDGPFPRAAAQQRRQGLSGPGGPHGAREHDATADRSAYLGRHGASRPCWHGRIHADELETWLKQDAAYGFNVICNHYPKPLEEFCALVVPELRRRGVFRREYGGWTLRDHLGLRVPENRHTQRRMPGRPLRNY